MKTQDIKRFRSELEAFSADMILHMGSRDRLGDKKTSGFTLQAVRRWVQKYLLMYTGTCAACGRKIPRMKGRIIIYDDS